jgi:hypothetical protein
MRYEDLSARAAMAECGCWSIFTVAVHDVSNQITAAENGRYRGSVPRSKNSMMVMRPPQQGQGGKTVSAGSSLPGLAFACAGGIAPSSSRSRAILTARPVEANVSLQWNE